MPLESLLETLKDTKSEKENPLPSEFGREHGKITTMKKNTFKLFESWKELCDKFLGQCSLSSNIVLCRRQSQPAKVSPK